MTESAAHATYLHHSVIQAFFMACAGRPAGRPDRSDRHARTLWIDLCACTLLLHAHTRILHHVFRSVDVLYTPSIEQFSTGVYSCANSPRLYAWLCVVVVVVSISIGVRGKERRNRPRTHICGGYSVAHSRAYFWSFHHRTYASACMCAGYCDLKWHGLLSSML